MLLELAGFFGLIILGLVFFAEFGDRKPVLGIIASVFMLVMGYWLTTDGIQIKSSESIETFDNGTSTDLGNGTTHILMNSTQTITTIYSEIPNTPFISIPNVFSFVFILLGLFGVFFYVWKAVE